ncbi:MAG: hypothetical protein MUF42_02880 [Cytophagaceae bacterium]|nr:hypothetical protein [Cytophagaceae bacterium]
MKRCIVTILLTIVLLVNCNRKKDSIGPVYYLAGKDFQCTSFYLPDTLNFRKSKVFSIRAEFSSVVSWTLELKGLKSGASRIFKGNTNRLDSSIVSWRGGHDGLPFFKKGEQVQATVSFMGSELKVTGVSTIKNTVDFGLEPNVVTPVSVDSNGYEYNSKTIRLEDGVFFPKQFSFHSSNSTNYRRVDSLIPAVQGNKYYTIFNRSYSSDGYFVGGLQHRKVGGFYFPDWKEVSNVYFNVYVYGTGVPGTRMNLQFHEADPETDAFKSDKENDSTCGGTYKKRQHCPCVDDAWQKQVSIDHVGWKLISVPYTEFEHSNVPNNGDKGNFRKEPHRIHWIQLTVISGTPFQEVQAIWDYPVITYGGPFDPSI